ncbi:MAG TPA: peptidoglycan DD-metalloendopeptidase family protein [Thermoanaerobaculia bacterium]|jgi:murein DD-endopeptidase MepM/ murein hydrolase activator NlpD|nr:peptidoglycan DD-metalloendopeptidase family protein [Thermoanaerobaculia bacterium]
MDGKRYTIILVPHTRAKFRKFQVSTTVLWSLLSVAGLLIVTAAVFGWLFLAAPVDETQVSHLRHENSQLRQVNQSFEQNIRQLQGQLAAYEERTRKLAIVAGIEELDNGGDAGIGGSLAEHATQPGQASVERMTQRLQGLAHDLDRVEGTLTNRFRWLSAMPTVTPTGGLFTSGFGVRRDPVNGRPAFHEGLDIAAPPGRAVHVTADGVVVLAGPHGDLGTAVIVSHGYGITTRYGHLSGTAVQPGQRIRRGDVVGYVGNTGHSTGYHLHYEVLKDGAPVNPLGYILDRPLGGAGL